MNANSAQAIQTRCCSISSTFWPHHMGHRELRNVYPYIPCSWRRRKKSPQVQHPGQNDELALLAPRNETRVLPWWPCPTTLASRCWAPSSGVATTTPTETTTTTSSSSSTSSSACCSSSGSTRTRTGGPGEPRSRHPFSSDVFFYTFDQFHKINFTTWSHSISINRFEIWISIPFPEALNLKIRCCFWAPPLESLKYLNGEKQKWATKKNWKKKKRPIWMRFPGLREKCIRDRHIFMAWNDDIRP